MGGGWENLVIITESEKREEHRQKKKKKETITQHFQTKHYDITIFMPLCKLYVDSYKK